MLDSSRAQHYSTSWRKGAFEIPIPLPDDQSGPSPHMSNIGEYYYLVLDKR